MTYNDLSKYSINDLEKIKSNIEKRIKYLKAIDINSNNFIYDGKLDYLSIGDFVKVIRVFKYHKRVSLGDFFVVVQVIRENELYLVRNLNKGYNVELNASNVYKMYASNIKDPNEKIKFIDENTLLVNLDLSTRLYNCLRSIYRNIPEIKVLDILNISNEECNKTRNFGEKSIKELKSLFESCNIELKNLK